MNEETIGVLIAGVILVAFLWFTRNREQQAAQPIGSNIPTANALAAAVNPDQFEQGPSYFIANQPYYFAPPVANMMPKATASNTVTTNVDDGSICGCG